MKYSDLKISIQTEIWVIRQYLDTIELNQSHLIKLESERYLTEAKLFSITDKEEYIKTADQMGEVLEHYVIPRYLGNSFIIILCSLFEDAMTEIAKYVQERDTPAISLSDLKGDFLHRLGKFFENKAVFFQIDSSELQELKYFYLIRNQIVHENSRITDTTNRQKIKMLIDTDIGISELAGRIIIEEKYCRSMLEPVNNVIHKQLDVLPEWFPYDLA